MSDEINSEKKETDIVRPGFDARLQYYKVLQNYMVVLAQARFSNDFILMYNTLEGMLDMVIPYINQKEGEEIDKIISKSKHYIYLNDKRLNDHIHSLLNKASRKIHQSSKHMMLPISTESNTEFSEDDFLRGSDL